MKSKTTPNAVAAELSKEKAKAGIPQKHGKSTTCPTSPPLTDTGLAFDPTEIYYSTDNGAFYVDVGTHYRAYQRKTPVKSGIRRFLERQGVSENDMKDLLNMHLENIELDRAVDWVGSLAGHRRGIFSRNGRSLLIMDQPDIPETAGGECPLHLSIIDQAFPDGDARAVFLKWLADGVSAIRQQVHQPAPMLVMAGPAKAGKSLLAHISTQALGGRSANPMTTWTGKLPWNDNLLGSELLLIDDSVSSTDPRARKAFGANCKACIYAADVEINTRGKSSISLRPIWRVMVCCNETPENLSVIPPLEDGIEDKIILLKISPVRTPMPAQTAQEKAAFTSALAAELPAFLRFLESVEIPSHLSDSRSGVTAWQDPDLLEAVSDISPEKRLENLLSLCISKGFMGIDEGESTWMGAAEVQSKLQARDSPTSGQAHTLLKFDANCGRYLSQLAKNGSHFVTNTKTVKGTTHYLITR